MFDFIWFYAYVPLGFHVHIIWWPLDTFFGLSQFHSHGFCSCVKWLWFIGLTCVVVANKNQHHLCYFMKVLYISMFMTLLVIYTRQRSNHIILFKAITMLCRIDNILKNIPHIRFECEELFVGLTVLCRIFFTFSPNVKIFCRILSVPQNIGMALNNVMHQHDK